MTIDLKLGAILAASKGSTWSQLKFFVCKVSKGLFTCILFSKQRQIEDSNV